MFTITIQEMIILFPLKASSDRQRTYKISIRRRWFCINLVRLLELNA